MENPNALQRVENQGGATQQHQNEAHGLEPMAAEHQSKITPAQAKVDAIASLTMTAYAKAATLVLTDEEIAELSADFPDEAFKPGAGGKENLIYIEHAYLRERLNKVFRPGQWSIVPRNRWAEPFRTPKGTEGSRVYVEAMLIIRGAFVSEAIGEMEYYPSNASQNYGDAVEGAKTAALRRCCKELGVGLQAWKKDFGDGWWARKGGNRFSQSFSQARSNPGTIPTESERQQPKQQATPTSTSGEDWANYVVHWGSMKGTRLGDLPKGKLWFFATKWSPQTNPDGSIKNAQDAAMRAAAIAGHTEMERAEKEQAGERDDVPM